jgi:predicted DNA-binding transcriptional regulator YafY
MYERFQDLLQIAQMMRAGWVTLADIEREAGVSRRTAERIRDAMLVAFPGYEEKRDIDGIKGWRISADELKAITMVSAVELEELNLSASRLESEGLNERARLLTGLRSKIAASLRSATYRRLQPDLMALMEAEGHLVRPGPAPSVDPDLIHKIRTSILSGLTLKVSYQSRLDQKPKPLELRPQGLVFGPEHYLVADPSETRLATLKLYRLSGISNASVTQNSFEMRPDFSLADFISGSVGIFQEPPRDIKLVFIASAARDVINHRFHITQRVQVLDDGSIEVTFRAGGLMELCWHLFTWGDRLISVQPTELAELYGGMLRTALGAVNDAR